MNEQSTGIIGTLMGLPVFQAEWVLWLLLGLSVVSVAIMIERAVFYRRHTVNIDKIRNELSRLLNSGDFDGAARLLAEHDSLETNVVLFGLKNHRLGPEAVEDLLAGATGKEQSRYDKRLNVLATVASNAPFIGLFGTVLGIIRAFNDLAGNMSEASSSVMAGIAEALIATAVGLLVAIPAVVAYNIFKSRVKKFSENLGLLASVLTANLKAVPADASAKE
ncbi:MAG: MotA/TolQ/ExbB proton channel family protein [Deltaproteobacteria bacterium]|nr:MotA/TolQ/ExbB proton channel family protein [Deltaproteobacteria bacterium]